MFVGAYLRVEQKLLHSGSLLPFPHKAANIRLDWKGLIGTNTLAYYKN
jgi:hypothetical protein